MCRPKIVISRAVDKWPDCVRPWAFLKVVRSIPIARAVRVMRLENSTSEPAMASPIAVAASLADLIEAARMRYRNWIFWPVLSHSFDGGSDEAWRETVT